MKRILFFLFLLLSLRSNSQVMNQSLRAAYGYTFQRGQFDSTLLVPLDSSIRFNAPRRGAIIYNSGDSALYVWNGSWWLKQGRAGFNGIDISKALDSARWSHDTLFLRQTTGGELAIKITGLPQANINGLPDSLQASDLQRVMERGNISNRELLLDAGSGGGRLRFRTNPSTMNIIYSQSTGAASFRPLEIATGGLMVSDRGGSIFTDDGVNALQVQGSGFFSNTVEVDRSGGSQVNFLAKTTDDNQASIAFQNSTTRPFVISYIGNSGSLGVRNKTGEIAVARGYELSYLLGGIPAGRAGSYPSSGLTTNYTWFVFNDSLRRTQYPFEVNSPVSFRDTVHVRSMPAGTDTLPVVALGADSLLHKIPSVMNTSLYGLLTGASLPIQPTDLLLPALAKLQAQYNSVDGTYIKLISATAQPSASAYIQGVLKIKGNSGTSFPIVLERGSVSADDATMSFLSAGNRAGYFGMANRNADHISLTALRNKLIFTARDTARIDFVELQGNGTAKIRVIIKGGSMYVGDSLSGGNGGGVYPLDIISTKDTSIYALHKIVSLSNIIGVKGVFSSTVGGANAVAGSDFTTLSQVTALIPATPTWQQVMTAGATITVPMIVNATANSTWGGIITNSGTTTANGLYVNIGASSTGIPFLVARNAVSAFSVNNAGRILINNPTDDGSTQLQITGGASFTNRVTITGTNGYGQLRLVTSYTPTSSADTNGTTGDIAKDDNYIYVKTSTGWKRTALSTF